MKETREQSSDGNIESSSYKETEQEQYTWK